MTGQVDIARVAPGFADPTLDSQQAFRSIMDAFAHPGRIEAPVSVSDPPAPLHHAAVAVALTLLDHDTPVWLSPSARSGPAADFLRFHCGCPIIAAAGEAGFVIVASPEECPDLDDLAIGDDRYPDRSATVIMQLPALSGGSPLSLRGPGIDGERRIMPDGLPTGFAGKWADNHRLYPCGIDMIFTSGRDLVALPRTIKVEA